MESRPCIVHAGGLGEGKSQARGQQLRGGRGSAQIGTFWAWVLRARTQLPVPFQYLLEKGIEGRLGGSFG